MKPYQPPRTTVTVYVVGVLGTFLIVAGLIGIMFYYTLPAPVDQARVKERLKNLADLNAQNKEQLEHYAYIDRAKGILRLPITRAMELTAMECQNPTAGRTNLLGRLDKALKQLPPAPNPYE